MVNVNEEKLVEYLKRVSADLHDTRLEGAQDRRQDATNQPVAQCRKQPLLVDRYVVAALELGI